MPAVGAAPEVKFPAVERATLANGLKIVLAERHAVPVVNLRSSSTPATPPTRAASPAPPAWP